MNVGVILYTQGFRLAEWAEMSRHERMWYRYNTEEIMRSIKKINSGR